MKRQFTQTHLFSAEKSNLCNISFFCRFFLRLLWWNVLSNFSCKYSISVDGGSRCGASIHCFRIFIGNQSFDLCACFPSCFSFLFTCVDFKMRLIYFSFSFSASFDCVFVSHFNRMRVKQEEKMKPEMNWRNLPPAQTKITEILRPFFSLLHFCSLEKWN